ncbi:MAG: hypothetical protein KJ548_11945, partial [Actinobacteria bacterium]|nr:hypothetical protein [Actinomycetota bacterium]
PGLHTKMNGLRRVVHATECCPCGRPDPLLGSRVDRPDNPGDSGPGAAPGVGRQGHGAGRVFLALGAVALPFGGLIELDAGIYPAFRTAGVEPITALRGGRSLRWTGAGP